MISLQDKRVLLTHADAFMGPVLIETLGKLGAQVIPSYERLSDRREVRELVSAAGRIDILIANLAIPAPSTVAVDVKEEEWTEVFQALVDPLPRLIAAVGPQMIERQSGKILIMGSASAQRGMKRASTYSAARGAQLAYARAVGVELARYGIQVNAIAQNFVDNPTYFPDTVQADPRFQARLQREVPLGRLVTAEEDAALVAYLCSDAANCHVGQVFPLSGGWA